MSDQFLLSDLIDLQEIDNEIYKIESEKKSQTKINSINLNCL